MINKVRPQPSDDPFKRGQSSKVGGTGKDHHVEKASEVDPEEQRKKFQQHLEEKTDAKPEDTQLLEKKAPSPYDSDFYNTTSIDKKNIKPQKSFENALDDEKDVPYFPKNQVEEKESNLANPSKDTKAKNSKKENFVKADEPLEISKKAPEKKKNFERDTDQQNDSTYIPTGPINVPFETLQRASEITSDLKVYLNAETTPLFEQMIGRFLVMSTKDGIMKTEITLNNPDMKDSVFYGSKITLEKYSTAPDSFNVRLTGSPEAVTMFNGNIHALMNAFNRGNFNFRINNIIASHEIREDEHLFRRKEKPAGGGPLEK